MGQSIKLDMKDATKDPDIAKLSFTLERQQVQAEDFKGYLIEDGGKLTEVNIPSPHVLDGRINGEKGDVFMIVNNENFRAEFLIAEEIHRLEPLSDLDFIENQEEESATARSAANCWKVEVSSVGDYELYRRFNYDVNYTLNWIYWRVVNGSRMYRGSYIDFIIKNYYVVHNRKYDVASSTNSTNFVNQWKNYIYNNRNWYNKGDINLLFTGRNIGGTTVGAAYERSICTSDAVGFVEYQSSPYYEDITTAHEIGHILGAGHSNGGFMNSNVNGGNTWMNPSTLSQLDNWLRYNVRCLRIWGCF